MKQLLFLLLFPAFALAQYQGNANQKITLGEQTTADGLVWRGVASIDTVTATSKITRANKQDTSAYILLDTVTNLLWHYKIGSNRWIQAGGGTAVTSITGGTGLTGGTITSTGTLAADTSFLFTQSDTLSLNLTNRFAAKQNNITLTTTGTSGAATLVNSTLNIPQYSGGGGVTDGDKGDIDVTNSGATWTIDTSAISLSGNKVTGTLPVANGGTGASVRTFVDTINTQTVNGAKTFTSVVTGTRFDPTANTVTGNGMYLPATNSLGFSTAGTQRIHINSAGKVGIATQMTTVNNLAPFNVNGAITFESDFIALRTNGSADEYAQFLLRESGTSGNFGTGETGQLEFITYSASNTIGALAIGTIQSRPVIFGTNALERVRVKGDGKMQIAGTTDRGTYNLQVNGTGVWGEGAYFNGSDANIKENIVDLDSSLNIVNNLKPVIFNYINTSVNNDTKHLGFIAQDVYQTLENKDYLNSIVRSDGDTLSIAYSNLIPLLTKAIQEQTIIIKQLEDRIKKLEEK